MLQRVHRNVVSRPSRPYHFSFKLAGQPRCLLIPPADSGQKQRQVLLHASAAAKSGTHEGGHVPGLRQAPGMGCQLWVPGFTQERNNHSKVKPGLFREMHIS